MTRTTFENSRLAATVIAHRRDGHTPLLLVDLRATAADGAPQDDPPAEFMLVLDRSGSMQGAKIACTRAAAARLIRSLRPVDRVGVVAFDDRIDVVAECGAPSEELAARVERIESRGSTNLHGGWLAGVRQLPPGGRVVLLSDGQANHGELQDAASLGRAAGIAAGNEAVITSTIGVGRDYDEALMAAMAREGGGGHYFCATVESILEAFAQERFTGSAARLTRAELAFGEARRPLGLLLPGEGKRVVFECPALGGRLELSYVVRATGAVETVELPLPDAFEEYPEAEAEWYVEQAARLTEQSGAARTQQDVAAAHAAVRSLLQEGLAHELADGDVMRAAIDRLGLTIDRLGNLEQNWSEGAAMLQRKLSMQSVHSMRHRGAGYAQDSAEEELVEREARMAYGHHGDLTVDPRAFVLRPAAWWRDRRIAPIAVHDDAIDVVLTSPKHLFVADDAAVELGRRLVPQRRFAHRDQIDAAITAAEQQPI